MAIISFASPKGGSGKSTAAVILGTELANSGANVHLVDCDPNHSLTIWSKASKHSANITTHFDITENTIHETITSLNIERNIIILDLEGVASLLVSRAIARSDLVITPMRPTILDAKVASSALRLVKDEEITLQRPIRHSVLFSSTKNIKSIEHKGIEKSLLEQKVHILYPPLVERAAFSAIFNYGGDLRSMPERGNQKAAIENAARFTAAVFNRLTEGENHAH